MARSYRKYDEDFKQGAVRLVVETGKPIAQVARELGVNEGTLGNWCAKARVAPGAGSGELSETERHAGRWIRAKLRRTLRVGAVGAKGGSVDVWQITLVALRRWYILLPLLAFTGVAVIIAGSRVAPEFEAQASAMLTPPRTLSDVPSPYGDITAANQVIMIVLNGVETRRAITASGLTPTYEVGGDGRSAIFRLTVRAEDPPIAEQTGEALIQRARDELRMRQDDVGLPVEAQIGLDVVEPPSVTATVESGKVRVQAVVALLGGGLALLIAVLSDDLIGLFKRPRQRGSRGGASEAIGVSAAARQAGPGAQAWPYPARAQEPAEVNARAAAVAPADSPRASGWPEPTRDSSAEQTQQPWLKQDPPTEHDHSHAQGVLTRLRHPIVDPARSPGRESIAQSHHDES